MKFAEQLKKRQYADLWQQYCGFLDMDLSSYMNIQHRLMLEQMDMWCPSPHGRHILRGARPKSVEEFRDAAPLTDYEDYAEILLQKKGDMLPMDPVIWIETTWEGGKHPVKTAPYTRSMLDVCRDNLLCALILATSPAKGRFSASANMKTLYGLAPLPYVTGLFPLLLDEEIKFTYFPPIKSALSMSFGARNKKGFEMSLHKGLDMFFGLSSVISYISESFINNKHSGSSAKSILEFSPTMLLRYIAASYRCKRDNLPLMPKDIFKLKGLVCAGTDTSHYKRALEKYWGCTPLEIAAGTEPTCIGTETWQRNGTIFFPDACFYEFIPENEMNKNLDDPSYVPKTYLMNEVLANQNYELVISVLKGGAFARYRVGDVYRCISTGSGGEEVALPRFAFLDRVPTIIDIAGFTRITEDTIRDVIRMSGLPIQDWFALKEYNHEDRPFLHMYVELSRENLADTAADQQVLKDHLSVYFNYFDSDYQDLKRLLGIEPLQITILRSGIIERYKQSSKERFRRINPPPYIISEILKYQLLR